MPNLYLTEGAGKARNASGMIFENLIHRICNDNGYEARKNDYKKTEEIEGISLKNLQVDNHIYQHNVMKKASECKTYLDSCYLKRAVIDFIELNNSPEVPDDVEYAIIAGQECVSKDSLNYYCAYFKKMTGKEVKIFIINKFKKRNAKKAIYMKKFNDDFQLDIQEVEEFVKWLKK